MNLTNNNIITIENKVRHILKTTGLSYKNYEYHPEEIRTYSDENDNKYEELFNAEIYINVEGSDKKFSKIESKLSHWAYKKFDGLILYLNKI